ncbi:hypothetical protein T4D_15670 [Trichinella pseudospiralis]|uniref:Uncharacterized protein n=1 Tax=Trichinella pseudospiralis TaxID=6337 RepID=A0A0V1FP57_TRIPS|nr:hypothetical protein T4D_15670 [Trichinella pseudospiralis]
MPYECNNAFSFLKLMILMQIRISYIRSYIFAALCSFPRNDGLCNDDLKQQSYVLKNKPNQ